MTVELDGERKERPSWDEYFLRLADVVAERGTCPRLKVGAVLVRDKNPISTGYNGAPRGIPHCEEVGCYLVNGHCKRANHSEANAIINAAYNGISTKDTILYTRYLPCDDCAKDVVNAGVSRVVYREVYKNVEQPFTLELFEIAGIELVCIPDNKYDPLSTS